ncbi:MAG: rRNA pseudouridine synthase [Candidatus Aminicenantes bacterium]|nr:rRNA pseudouridine synthase [Candidatus Aminicenantes bacterium]
MQIRLNKFLAQAGIASRREADRFISEGRVKVNGKIVRTLGVKIEEETDTVEVDGRRVESKLQPIYLMLNKPPGYLVTSKDPFQRPTIMSLLPPLKKRVFPVGRLDYDSSGLLLLTNDGELANRLMHPRYNVKKVYLVKVLGLPDGLKIMKLQKGIYLDGKKTAPAKIMKLSSMANKTLFRVEIHEGRKREIKQLFKAIGHKVVGLERIKFANLSLGFLKKGQWRFLMNKEIASLKKQVGLE